MAPTSSSHGPLYDVFTAASGSPHGGAAYDEFDKPNTGSSKHGARYDEFGKPAVDVARGEHWDEFGWVPMPAMHGQNFDCDFAQPAALDGADHGTWFDVFRGGTQVRAIVDGKDVEGTIISCETDHVVMELKRGRNNGGGRVEAGLGQIKELRYATEQGQASETRKPAASPGNTPAPMKDSPAHAPSAHSATAHGGGERTTIDVSESKAIHVTGKTSGLSDVLDVLKTQAAEVAPPRPFDGGDGDVAKAVKSALDRAEYHHQRAMNAYARAARVPRMSPDHAEHMATAAHHFMQATAHYRDHASPGAAPITHSI